VARKVGLPRATVRRSLLTLVQLGYAEEDARLFRLTPRVLRLAAAYLGSGAAPTLLQPACDLLCAEYGETFSVAVLDGEDAVMIAYATPRRMYMEATGIGLRLPAYCTAVGRVLLAGLEAPAREAFLDRLNPRPATPRSVTSKPALRRILAQVEHDGYAIAEEEAEIGFSSISVPVRRLGGQVAYALNTGMPVGRASSEQMRTRFLPRLLAEAQALQKQLL